MPLNRTRLPSAVMLLVSGGGMLLAFGATALLLLLGFLYLAAGSSQSEVIFIAVALAWESALVGILALPAAIFSFFSLIDRPFNFPDFPPWFNSSLALILVPFLVGIGYLASRLTAVSWLILPPLQILVLGIPIWWLVSASGNGFPGERGLRDWKLLSVALLVTNPLIFFLELVIFFVGGFLWIAGHPDFIVFIQTAVNQVMASNLDPQRAEAFVSEFLSFPGVIAGIFISVSVAAPLIEEFLKTCAVWLLFKKELTPSRGFAVGAVCGAAFALVESLGALSRPFDSVTWAAVVIGRVGTGIMHILAAGLSGWGIASLASRGKIGHTLLGYLAAFSLHGLWNFCTITAAIHPYLDFSSPAFRFFDLPGQAGMAIVAFLAVIYLGAIILINRNLRPAVGFSQNFEVK